MRDILFKAKRISDGQWVEGYLYKQVGVKDRIYFAIEVIDNTVKAYEVDESTICQYTGLTDKNGNKIWENDILSVLLIGETDEQKENCIVRYGRKTENFRIELGFNLEWTKTDYLRCDICFWTENREVEVIGNIFDNPELIGE